MISLGSSWDLEDPLLKMGLIWLCVNADSQGPLYLSMRISPDMPLHLVLGLLQWPGS